jgi:hypothetical protein
MNNLKWVIGLIFLIGVCATSLWAGYNLAIRFPIMFGAASVCGLSAFLTALLRAPRAMKTKMVLIFAHTANKRDVLDL